MALTAHQLQGSYYVFPKSPSLWSRGNKLKHFQTLHAAGRNNRFTSLKCKSCLSVGAPSVLGTKTQLFKISAFKGSSSDDAGSRSSGSKTLQNPVNVSYIRHESEESSVKSPVQNIPLSCTSTADETAIQSLSIQNLFKNWLMLLRVTSQNQQVNEVLDEPSLVETLETQNSLRKLERVVLLKAVWCSFLGLDATIKIPLLIFFPLYLAVNLVYGSVVSRELTPLWVLGPLIVALYIKMVQLICGLYSFSFKQAVKVVKNLPFYYLLLHNYIVRGKFKEGIRSLIWQHVRNMDYKEVMKRKAKDLEIGLVEKYQDYVESIWPFYCRMIKFLKRANLV
ncbi:uncharacterized protein LOC111409917 isoform X2 [Olea europaea var. sylvestris]|uniref:uncharacterized protein LOC111409917 isoform X1 n=1 Tax=Olea europaea var. sylvestris TaxID=158386 RepID=UPI000C1D801A|nr:uncharacterized protein LOC111409917 isoform X1 [Olea europaea var. sylvestris]XP_022895909.1 uncharacterized protein LOC111409917 isoform X1 [Olea europaea var. sylvestris]XP_022895982.1 uncharacterized protein LOC111409917 isoform X2 [Olea europaea var. sylvestris]